MEFNLEQMITYIGRKYMPPWKVYMPERARSKKMNIKIRTKRVITFTIETEYPESYPDMSLQEALDYEEKLPMEEIYDLMDIPGIQLEATACWTESTADES